MHPKVKEQVDRINSDIEAKAFRDEVLAIAATRGTRVDVVASALADVLGIAAARLDAEEGASCTLQDRLHAFCERVAATYLKCRNRPEAA